MDPDQVAKAFVDHYFTTFDTNRTGLVNLYQDSSMLTFEGEKIMGVQGIVGKLTSLPFQQCKHNITTVDCQPSAPGAGGMLVFVSGQLQLAGESHSLRFSQLFHLMATPQGSFYVQNDIFRLNYGLIESSPDLLIKWSGGCVVGFGRNMEHRHEHNWGPVFIATVLFVLLTPGLLFQLPGGRRCIEFGTFHTSAPSILIHSLLNFGLLCIFLIAIGVHLYAG